jgi:hypothetical protein
MRLSTKLALCTVCFTGFTFAERPVSIGVKGGVPLSNAFSLSQFTSGQAFEPITSFSDSKNYIVGGFVELRLPLSISVEGNALYRPLNVTTKSGSTTISSEDYSSWEFPILAKFHLPLPIVKPFIAVGPSFRTASSNLGDISNAGIAGGVGADIKIIVLRLSPQFLYTHWGSSTQPTSALNIPLSKQDQVEFLVGLSF